jgi:hypothetical protein
MNMKKIGIVFTLAAAVVFAALFLPACGGGLKISYKKLVSSDSNTATVSVNVKNNSKSKQWVTVKAEVKWGASIRNLSITCSGSSTKPIEKGATESFTITVTNTGDGIYGSRKLGNVSVSGTTVDPSGGNNLTIGIPPTDAALSGLFGQYRYAGNGAVTATLTA